jgi:hypothetical protein
MFALGLMSDYEEEHMSIGLLGQGNLIQGNVLQFHPFTANDNISFFFMAA